MGLAIYTSADDFPQSISSVLSPKGIKVTEHEKESDQLPLSFGYNLERGFGKIHVFGAKEDDLMAIMFAYGSLNPLRWHYNRILLKDATETLLASGMREFTKGELM